MSYDTVATFTQVLSLLIFIGLFVVVLLYAGRPGNRQRFERAARESLDLDTYNRNIDTRNSERRP